ncbi:MAG TPA: site-2 protease family protein, partial [Micropepsaceae bacterium]|nr:site-2 protease family protein [Micropepsaceae bacterium]
LTLAAVGLGLTWFVVFLFSTTLHEASHAFAAYRLGDPTAYHGGQVTLNPLPHVMREPIGMVVIPLLTFFTRGWMMGWASAPYDPAWARRYPKRAAIMALAGPAANLTLVLIASLGIRAGMAAGIFKTPETISFTHVTASAAAGPAAGAVVPLSLLFSLNLLLFLFNLLPLPPLDGSKVIAAFLPESLVRPYIRFGRYGMVVLVLLVFVVPLFAARRGLNVDIFGWLVLRPADALTRTLLSLIGRG